MKVNNSRPTTPSTQTEQNQEVQRELFTQTRAVRVISRAYKGYEVKSNREASIGARELLATCATPVTDLSTLNADDVIVVHRRSDIDSKKSHSFFGAIEELYTDGTTLVTLYEISAKGRDAEAELLCPMPHPAFPDMGIYKGCGFRQNTQLQYFIDNGEMFKLNCDREEFEFALNCTISQLQNGRDTAFFGATYGCNNFVYDVLKAVSK